MVDATISYVLFPPKTMQQQLEVNDAVLIRLAQLEEKQAALQQVQESRWSLTQEDLRLLKDDLLRSPTDDALLKPGSAAPRDTIP